jgi:RNA-binding motif X-linked protein 2
VVLYSSPPEASWHADYRDTAYIYIGGLPFELTEGDILTIFSQFGEPVHLNLVRDKDTGKSKGFAFLKYEDQRSTDLAVDNLGGASVMGRLLRVDHVRYKRREEEGLVDNLADVEEGVGMKGDDEARDMKRKKKMRRTESESDGEERRKKRPLLKEERELARLIEEHDDEDPMKEFLIQEKKEEVERALEMVKSSRCRGESEEHRRHHRHHRHHHRHRHGRSRSREKRSPRHRSRSRSTERRRHKERRDRDRSR